MGAQTHTEGPQAALGREAVSFTVALPPRALRVNHATRSTAYRARLRREYQEEVWCAGRNASAVNGFGRRIGFANRFSWPWQRARLRLVWRHAGPAPDPDNCLATLKPLIDVLHTRSARPLGIVIDDAAEHLIIEPVQVVKVAHRHMEGIDVEIEQEDA